MNAVDDDNDCNVAVMRSESAVCNWNLYCFQPPSMARVEQPVVPAFDEEEPLVPPQKRLCGALGEESSANSWKNNREIKNKLFFEYIKYSATKVNALKVLKVLKSNIFLDTLSIFT